MKHTKNKSRIDVEFTIYIDEESGTELIDGREFHEAVGIKTAFTEWMRRYTTDFKVDYDYIFRVGKVNGTYRHEYYLTKKTAIKMLNMCCKYIPKNKAKAVRRALKSIGIDNNNPNTDNSAIETVVEEEVVVKESIVEEVVKPTVETVVEANNNEFFTILEKVLAPMGLIVDRGYQVLSHKIDGYIIDLNIAIEIDKDNTYTTSTIIANKMKEDAIRNEIGCEIIRLRESDDVHHNVGLIIKKIIELL